MASRLHYLYLSSSGLIGLRQSGHSFEESARFNPEFEQDDQGLSTHLELSHWLKGYRDDIFIVIVDFGEEDFLIEQVPKMGRKDEAAVIQRRLGHKFRDARLSQWTVARAKSRKLISLKKTPAEPVRVLMSVVAKDPALSAWLASVERARVAVRSVVSPALLAQRLMLHRLKIKSAMIVSWSPAGLRQTVLLDGEVRFSRLTGKLLVPDVASIQIECLRTIQYLLMSQQISRDILRSTGMPIWVVEGGIADLKQLPNHLTVDSSVDVSLGRIPSKALAPETSSRLGALPAWCEVESLAPTTGSTRFAYADKGLRQGYVVRSCRRWLMGTGAGALVCASLILVGSLGLKALWSVESEKARIQTQLALAQQRSLAIELAKFAVPGPEMRAVVDIAEQLRRRHVAPIGMMQYLAKALEADVGLEISALRWKRIESAQSQDWASLDLTGKATEVDTGGGGVKKPQSGATSGFGQVPLGSGPLNSGPLNSGPLASGTPTVTASTSRPTDMHLGPVVLELQGAVTAQSPMQLANDQVNQLARRFREKCGCEVKVSKLPFDPDVISGFNKSFEAQGAEGRAKPSFGLRAMWRETPDDATAEKLSSRHAVSLSANQTSE